MPAPPTFDEQIAHIVDGNEVFQVLLPDASNWDETETRAAYEAWRAQQS